MVNIYDVNRQKLIEEASKELKKSVKVPEWSKFVKTGHFKERPPVNTDWWYLRTASVLTKIYKLGPIGVSKLRTLYGSKKNKGSKPEHRYRASGKIIRTVLQQLQELGYIKYEDKTKRKGRKITPKGKSFLDKIATSMIKNGSGRNKKEETGRTPGTAGEANRVAATNSTAGTGNKAIPDK